VSNEGYEETSTDGEVICTEQITICQRAGQQSYRRLQTRFYQEVTLKADSVIAAQVYTCRDFTNTLEELDETFGKLAQIGYETVELAGIGAEHTAKQMKELLDSHGLIACATHTGFADLRDNPEEQVEYHKAIDCEYTVTGGWEKALATEADWIAFAREANEVGRRLKSLGLSYGYHNHSHEFEKFGERTAMEILFEESDPKFVFAEIDTYWVQHGGASPIVWINKLSDRLPLLHLKDMAMRGREQLYAEVGEGNLDWEGILAAAQVAGVKWYIVEQDTCQRDPFESLAISFNNLKKMGIE